MLVSVIIPTYNREGMLKEAIDSVLLQDYSDLELIVVDDGSVDATQALCQSYGDRLRYFYTENRGVSHARNVGIRESMIVGSLVSFRHRSISFRSTRISISVRRKRSGFEMGSVSIPGWFTKNIRVGSLISAFHFVLFHPQLS